jgi:hypothetical protein
MEGGSQLKVMENGVNANAAKFNELKLEADRKTKELKNRIDSLQSLKLEVRICHLFLCPVFFEIPFLPTALSVHRTPPSLR